MRPLFLLSILLTLLVGVQRSDAGGDEPLVLKGHTGWVGGVAFAPDGTLLATGSADQTVRLWELPGGRLQRTFSGHTETVSAVAFSPDGKTLASASFDGTVRLWDAATGKSRAVLRAGRGAVLTIAFSSDGKRLATGGFDSRVYLWETEAGVVKQTLKGHRSWVNAVAWSTSDHLATGSSDGTVRLWNASGTFERELVGSDRDGEVRSVTWAADGKSVAAGMRYGVVNVWSVSDGQLERALRGHRGDVWAVAFSPDGKLLASADGDWRRPGQVKLWSAASGASRAELRHTGEVLSLAFSSDSRCLVAGSWDRTVHVWAKLP